MKYPTLQRTFLDNYMSKMSKIGFNKPFPQASWEAAPHAVPKDAKALIRSAIDLRSVNAATKVEQWPMPRIESELSDFKG